MRYFWTAYFIALAVTSAMLIDYYIKTAQKENRGYRRLARLIRARQAASEQGNKQASERLCKRIDECKQTISDCLYRKRLTVVITAFCAYCAFDCFFYHIIGGS